MKLTQKLIDQIQEAMLHTNLKGEINWKDGDDIASKNPWEPAQPHPRFDYEKKEWKKDEGV